ncbi:MAG: hypothetical protein IJ491_08640 [Clostridia bacterium]|nr:hypothetical protein [Clostridia bacterium]
MKKIFTVVVALCLCFCLTFSSVAAGVETNTESYTSYSAVEKMFFNIVDDLVSTLVKAIAHFIPTPDSWNSDEAVDGFMEGTEEFLDAPAANAKWSLGYDSRSILPENKDDVIGKYYVAGTIGFEPKYATEVYDDLKVRTVVLNDGSGRGSAVFCVIDSYGLALSDVRGIRSRLSSWAEEKGINTITVSVMHQHSAIDTFGMNGNIIEMVLFNPLFTMFNQNTVNGKDDAYMENLFTKCVDSIKAAEEGMAEGEMYLGTADASKYTNDKRQPYVMDANFNRLRFVPADGSKETWLVSTPIHCVGNGAGGTEVTGDYPYYAEQTIGDTANVLFYLGAEEGTTQERNENTVVDFKEDGSRMDHTIGFGKAIANDLMAITDETEVAPLLNIRYKEIYLPIDNQILVVAGKAGLFENCVKKVDGTYSVLTEIGYMEIGEDIAFAIIPGEIAAELVYGGTLKAEYAWSGEDFEWPSLQEIVTETAGDRELHVLGLANDQIGYIIPDNDYMPMLHEDSKSLEFVSLGETTASRIVAEFNTMMLDLD